MGTTPRMVDFSQGDAKEAKCIGLSRRLHYRRLLSHVWGPVRFWSCLGTTCSPNGRGPERECHILNNFWSGYNTVHVFAPQLELHSRVGRRRSSLWWVFSSARLGIMDGHFRISLHYARKKRIPNGNEQARKK